MTQPGRPSALRPERNKRSRASMIPTAAMCTWLWVAFSGLPAWAETGWVAFCVAYLFAWRLGQVLPYYLKCKIENGAQRRRARSSADKANVLVRELTRTISWMDQAMAANDMQVRRKLEALEGSNRELTSKNVSLQREVERKAQILWQIGQLGQASANAFKARLAEKEMEIGRLRQIVGDIAVEQQYACHAACHPSCKALAENALETPSTVASTLSPASSWNGFCDSRSDTAPAKDEPALPALASNATPLTAAAATASCAVIDDVPVATVVTSDRSESPLVATGPTSSSKTRAKRRARVKAKHLAVRNQARMPLGSPQTAR